MTLEFFSSSLFDSSQSDIKASGENIRVKTLSQTPESSPEQPLHPDRPCHPERSRRMTAEQRGSRRMTLGFFPSSHFDSAQSDVGVEG